MWKLYLNLLNKKLFFIFLIFILLIPEVEALGTLQKKRYIEIESGKIAEFTILFWNSELPIKIELKKRIVPKNWIVIIEPKEFILNKNFTSSEIITLQNKYIKAFPVKIFVIVPEETNPGNYEIVINMVAGRTERGISFFQEKSFNFKINVSTPFIEQVKIPINESVAKPVGKTGNSTIPTKEIEEIIKNPIRVIFFSVVVALFLIVSWVVYRL